MTWNCETCFDTKTIDSGGREVVCPDCRDWYKPHNVTHLRNVTVGGREFAHGIWDETDGVGYWYGATDDIGVAIRMLNKRRGVVKAAITRRANKARKIAAGL